MHPKEERAKCRKVRKKGTRKGRGTMYKIYYGSWRSGLGYSLQAQYVTDQTVEPPDKRQQQCQVKTDPLID